MNWDAIGAIGEIIGAIAVVLSVAYLAFQIKQNTRQMEQSERTAIAASVSSSQTSYRENRQSIYTNPEVADIQMRGIMDPMALSDIELYRFRLMTSNFMDANWDMYSQTVVTGFSPETWQTQGCKAIARIMNTPGGRWFWENYAGEYPEVFRNEINSIIAGTDPGDR